jgi:transcriptional regulator with XRE-family HTH domain
MKKTNLIKIGLRIRQIRKERNFSLQDVAGRSGLSKSLISKVENFRTIPSLSVLSRIAEALRVTVAEIVKGIEGGNKQVYVLARKNERRILQRESAKGFIYELLITENANNSLFESFVLTLEKGARRKPVSTDGHEFLFILRGKIEFHYGKEKIILKKGDSIFFNGRIPHVPKNIRKGKAKFLVVYLLNK